MVVQLPVSSKGIPRRRGTARSATSGDVPVVTSPGDPGVQMPANQAAAAALQTVSQVANEEANLNLRVAEREAGLARDADDRAYTQMLQESLRNMQAAGDPSDPAAVEALGKEMAAKREEIIANHKGGRLSAAQLRDRLERRHLNFTDSLAVMNIAAADQRMNQTVDKRLGALTRDILTEPDVLDETKDTTEIFRRYSGMWEDDMNFMGLNERQQRFVRSAGQAEIIESMTTALIKNGDFERAKQLVRSDAAAEVMSPDAQRDVAQRVIAAEQALADAQAKGTEYLTIARNVLGPNATEEQVRAAAARAANMAKDDPGKKYVTVGDKVMVFDEASGTHLKTYDTGKTLQQQIDEQKALDEARLVHTVNTLNAMAEQAGAAPLPGGKSQDVSGQPSAAPAAEGEGEGEGAVAPPTTPTGPAVDLLAITSPLGEGVEATQDAQAVARMFTMARNLYLTGTPENRALAGWFTDRAKVLLSNSPQIRNALEGEKPIGFEMAQILGVPMGTPFNKVKDLIPPSVGSVEAEKESAKPLTMEEASELGVEMGTTRGQVRGQELRSPEERAAARTFATGEARKKSEALDQIMFINEADSQIVDLLEDLKEDPTLVGIGGALRSTGRSAITALQDLGLDFIIEQAKDIANMGLETEDGIPLEEAETGAEIIGDWFDDPQLSTLDIMANSMGLILARLRTPTGRIPVELIRLSIADVGLKGARGSKVVQDRLRYVQSRLDQRSRALKNRFGIKDEAGPEGAPGTPKYRIEGGTLVPVE